MRKYFKCQHVRFSNKLITTFHYLLKYGGKDEVKKNSVK